MISKTIRMVGLHASLSADERHGYLRRCFEIQRHLKDSGRLQPNQNWTGWFDKQLKELTGR